MRLIRLRRYVARALRRVPGSATPSWSSLVSHLDDDLFTNPEEKWQHLSGKLRLVCESWKNSYISDDQLIAGLKTFLRQSARISKELVKSDRAVLLDRLAQDMTRSSENGDSHQEWRSFKALLRFGGRPGRKPPSIRLRSQDDKPITSVEDESKVVTEFFADAEDAEIMDENGIRDFYNSFLNYDFVKEVDPLLLPDITKVSTMISKISKRKASGRDQVSTDVVSMMPKEVARHYAPIMLKAVLQQQEPLAWKHGTVVPLFKGKGSVAEIANYRSILLNGIIFKCHHTFLRHQLAGYLELTFRDSQCGGRCRHGPSQLGHLVSSYMQMAKMLGRGVVLNFVDLSSAFYTTVRSLVLPASNVETDDEFIVNNHEMPLAMLPLYSLALCQPSALSELRDRPHLLALVVESHRATHFSTKTGSLMARSRRGSRPGTSPADAIFNLSFGKPLEVASKAVKALGADLSLVHHQSPRIFRKAWRSLPSTTPLSWTTQCSWPPRCRAGTCLRRQEPSRT